MNLQRIAEAQDLQDRAIYVCRVSAVFFGMSCLGFFLAWHEGAALDHVLWATGPTAILASLGFARGCWWWNRGEEMRGTA